MRAEVPMTDKRALAPWIKRFLLEYLPADRNFARNTQHSYRDALRLFVIFASATTTPRNQMNCWWRISAPIW